MGEMEWVGMMRGMGGESKMVGIVVGRYGDGERETLRWVW